MIEWRDHYENTNWVLDRDLSKYFKYTIWHNSFKPGFPMEKSGN